MHEHSDRRTGPGGDMRPDMPLAGFIAASLLSALLWALAYLLWCAVGA